MHLGSERSQDSQPQPQRIHRAVVRRYGRRTTVRTRQHCLDEFCLIAAELAVKADEAETEAGVEDVVKGSGIDIRAGVVLHTLLLQPQHHSAYRLTGRVPPVEGRQDRSRHRVDLQDPVLAAWACEERLAALRGRTDVTAEVSEPAAGAVRQAGPAAPLDGVLPRVGLLVGLQLGDIQHLGDRELADRRLAVEVLTCGTDLDAVVGEDVEVLQGLPQVAACQ